jgi:iron complex transport system ATP-binding protein
VKTGPRTETSPSSHSNPPALAAEAIEVAYPQRPDAPPLIKDLSLKISPGELIAVVGPNGSGKSTLVRALSRTLKPRRGVVLLGEELLYTQVDARRSAQEIGVVPQETHVAFDFTVREVVSMGRAPRQKPFTLLSGESNEDRKAVDEALKRAGIGPDLAERKISAVSGGERQRALVARALAQEARILLLDEPTASLDIQHQTALLEWLQRLAHSERCAVLTVLHDLDLAASYADRVIVLSDGKIAAQGAPAEALTAETIQQVWNARVWVRSHPTSGRPYILHLPEPFHSGASHPEEPDTRPLAGLRIHILCGGGTGAPLMANLAGLGAAITAGALGQGDTDEEVASLLGIKHPLVSPFSPITEEAAAKSLEMARAANLIVLTEVPFGDGNLSTLEVAVSLAKTGLRILALSENEAEFAQRDYTEHHRATELWNELLALPNVRVAAATVGSVLEGQELVGKPPST